VKQVHDTRGEVHTEGVRVLVADDDPALRAALCRSLSLAGYEVETATDGTDALERLAVLRPDALVLDVLMPQRDGLEVCRNLRTAGDDLPVLMLTVRGRTDQVVAGFDAGSRRLPDEALRRGRAAGAVEGVAAPGPAAQ
jgi:DNA-binding response OmpR family regulator